MRSRHCFLVVPMASAAARSSACGSRLLLALLVALALNACREHAGGASDAAPSASASSAAPRLPGSAASAQPTASTAPAGGTASVAVGGDALPGEPLPIDELRRLMAELSEPDADFFSDNYVTNETSYLQVAERLSRHVPPGGAYLGVGPEQNFTYLALTRPQLAFIVDIRRGNLVLQLLYKAVFDLARTRSEFLTLLVGRPYDETVPLDPTASVAAVIAHAERLAPTKTSCDEIRERLRARIEQGYGIALSAKDQRELRSAQRAFCQRGLDLRFELKENSSRRYPPLRDLLAATDPEGQQRGFLASEEAFRFVQRLERENRVIPIVGDFAGKHALPAVAAELRRRALTVNVFYVSNVEQYLFENGVWHQWVANISALPTDDRSLFLRCYLDQGRSHPHQLEGHRTATVLQRIADFLERQRTRPYRSMWAVSTDEWVEGAAADAGR